MQGCGRRSVLPGAVALAAAVWAVLATSTLTTLAAANPLTIAVQVGYHNTVKLGQWMPVGVDITDNGPDFDGTLEIQSTIGPGAGPPIGPTVYEAPVSLTAGASKHFRTYVIQDFGGTITVRVVQAGRVVVSQQATSANTTAGLLIAVLSDRPSTLDQLGSLHPGGNSPQVVHLAAADVPDSAPVLRAFDVIAIDDFATDTLTSAQKTALDDYVQQGGALLLGAGGAWRKTLAGLPAATLPMQVTGSTVPASVAALGGGPGIEVATGNLGAGATAWLSDGGRPLLVEAPKGKGIVMLATFDWAQDSVTGWKGFTPVLRRTLVRITYGNPSNPTSIGPAIGKFGGSSQSIAMRGGTLSGALANLPALDLPAWWFIGALVFVYVLLVGPVNYLVLRAIGRRALAWVTVPTIALVAAGGAYGTSVVTKGTAVLANEVSVVHVQQGSGHGYLEEYTGIMAPTRGDYQVGIGGSHPMISPVYYFSGNIADPNFGAMRVNTVNSAIMLPGMTAFTLRAFASEGPLANAPDVSGQAQLAGGQLTGTVRNASGMEFTDGVVISGNAFQKLGELRPGTSASFSLQPGGSATLGGPPLMMTMYPSNFQSFNGLSANNTSDVEREMEMRSAVISTLIPNAYGGLPANPQPIVVLWTKQAFQSVTVNGAHPRTYVESAVVITLPIQQIGAGALPTGVVPARLVDLDADTTPAGPPGMLVATSGSITYEFDPSLAPGTHLTSAAITSSFAFGGKVVAANGAAATVKAQAWDWSAASWVDLTYQEAGATTVPDSAVNPITGGVLLRLSSSSQFAAGYLSLTGTVA